MIPTETNHNSLRCYVEFKNGMPKREEKVMIHKNVELYNVEELLQPEDGVGKLLTRVPNGLRETLNNGAKQRALSAAGCEIRFNIESGSAKVALKSEEKAYGIAEVFQGCFQASWHIVGNEPKEIPISLPPNVDLLDKVTKEKHLAFDAHLTRLVLPNYPEVRLIDIEGDTLPPRPEQTPKEKLLAYGSSITHGHSAIRPTGSYATKTAQFLGMDLINMGFGGGAHCERQMADYLASRQDWKVATLEMGINMVSNFETAEFQRRIEYFIEKIVRSHPDKWIFCLDMFTFYADFDPSSKKQNEFRGIIRKRVEELQMPKLVYVDGRTILENAPGLTVDLVHPSPFGMEEMAAKLSSLIRTRIEPI